MGPPKIAKLVQITPITMVYGTQITKVMGVYKPTWLSWGPHIEADDNPLQFGIPHFSGQALEPHSSGTAESSSRSKLGMAPSFIIWIKELRDILKLGKLYIIICVYIYIYIFDRCHTVVVVFKS